MVSQCQTIKKLWAGHESAHTDGQTDRQTDRQSDSYYPLNFVRGGYNNIIVKTYSVRPKEVSKDRYKYSLGPTTVP